jgi:hypothetical protein
MLGVRVMRDDPRNWRTTLSCAIGVLLLLLGYFAGYAERSREYELGFDPRGRGRAAGPESAAMPTAVAGRSAVGHHGGMPTGWRRGVAGFQEIDDDPANEQW